MLLLDSPRFDSIKDIIEYRVNAQRTFLESTNDQTYVLDTAGSETRWESYLTDYGNFLRNFLSLPDDHEVQLVIGEKDEICKICAIGAHCSEEKIQKAIHMNSLDIADGKL